jgi:soluble lytic murein transglycosylase-like protein
VRIEPAQVAPSAGAAPGDAQPAVAPPAVAPDAVAPARPGSGAAQSAPAGGKRPGSAPRAFNERMQRLDPQVLEVARRNGLDPLLLHALIHVESRHRMDAVSPAGARGAMQLMPQTAARFGVQSPQHLHDPEFNLAAGAAYLKLLQAEFGGDLDLALAAYNAGEGAVRRHGGRIPPYAESRAYVRGVRAMYERVLAEREREVGASPAGDPARLAMNEAMR